MAVATAPTTDPSELSASNGVFPVPNSVSFVLPSLSLTANASSSSNSLSFPPPMATPLPSNVGEIEYMPEEKMVEERGGFVAAQINARKEEQHPAQADLETASHHGGKIDDIVPIPSGSRKKIGGISVRLIVVLLVILIILGGTAVGWFFTIESTIDVGGTVLPIVIHTLFGTLVAFEFVMLKICVWRIRAERYTYKHPGETIPPPTPRKKRRCIF